MATDGRLRGEIQNNSPLWNAEESPWSLNPPDCAGEGEGCRKIAIQFRNKIAATFLS